MEKAILDPVRPLPIGPGLPNGPVSPRYPTEPLLKPGSPRLEEKDEG